MSDTLERLTNERAEAHANYEQARTQYANAEFACGMVAADGTDADWKEVYARKCAARDELVAALDRLCRAHEALQQERDATKERSEVLREGFVAGWLGAYEHMAGNGHLSAHSNPRSIMREAAERTYPLRAPAPVRGVVKSRVK